MKWFEHLKTVNEHRRLVREGCFRLGLIKQGLLHDLSKYSPSEFIVGARYYQGYRSPNNAEREARGYSAAWLHHKGRNKHHYEYWIDYNTRGAQSGEDVLIPVDMPDKYLAEMVMDRIAASKVYEGKKYTNASALRYFNSGIEVVPMHPNTKKKLKRYLSYLAKYGEEKTYALLRHDLKYGMKV